jgi:Holliday junction resolvase
VSGATGRARRRDDNELEIVKELLAAGATVTRLGERGVPDLLVGFMGVTLLIEVKTAGGHLTDDQVDWFKAWKGAPVMIVRTAAQARLIMMAIRYGRETRAIVDQIPQPMPLSEEEPADPMALVKPTPGSKYR